jgi:hypothetical protein
MRTGKMKKLILAIALLVSVSVRAKSIYCNASTDYITIANHASWATAQKISILVWVYTSDLAINQGLSSYQWDGSDRFRIQIDEATDAIGVYNYVNGDNVTAASSASSLTADTWTCVCVTFDAALTSNAIKIYIGELGGALGADDATEGDALAAGQTYSMGNAWYLANMDADDPSYTRCPIAVHVMLVGKILTQKQFQSIMYRPTDCMKWTETVMYHLPGMHGLTTIPDLSGTGNTGTGNSILASDGVPLGPYFGK